MLESGSLDEKDFNGTISFIEAKDMVRDAMTQPAVTASVSSYKSLRKSIKSSSGKITYNIYIVKYLQNLFRAEKITSVLSVLPANNAG